jgi:streptogramin lyase
MTATSDGNLWFLDSTNPATGAGRVGSLDTSTGVIHEFKLPKGFRLPATGAAIAAGPYGSSTVYFTLETASQQGSAIGVVTGTELVGP